jgi:predicted chitinase
MDENNQTSQEILEQLRIQTDAVNSLAGVFVKTMTTEQREQWMLDQNVKRTGNAFDKLNDNLNNLSEAEKARIAGEREAAAATKALKEAGASATKGLFNLSSTLSNTSADLTKWGSTIGGVGDVAMSVGKHFGVLGNTIGGVIKGFSVMAPMLLDQTQKMLKAFDSLSEMGGTTNMTTEQVRQLGRASGYTVDNLDKFVNSVKIVGKDINALGVNSAEGTKLFGKMTAVGEKNIQSYNRLGISQEQLTEAQAMYVKQSSNAGMALSKSPKELQKASLEYVDQLVKLKELTGMSIKESQSALDAAMAQENFNAYIHTKSMERSELESRAAKETDPIRQKELKERAAQIDQVIKSKQEMAMWSQSNESARDSTALLQSISRDSAPVYTQANAHFLTAGRNIEGVAEKLNKGQSALRDYQGEIAKSTTNVNKKMGESMYAYGDASKQIQESMGVDNQARKNAARFMESQTEEGKKRIAAEDKATEEQIRRRKEQGEILDAAGKPMRDGAKDTENTVLSLERALRGLKDDLLGALNPFTKSTFAASAASTALAAAAGIAAYKLGKMGVGSAVGGIGDLMNKGLPGRAGPAAGSLSGWKAGATAAQGAVGATSAVGGAGSAATAATTAASALSKLAGPLAGLSKAAPLIGTAMSVGSGVIDAYQGIKKADKDLKEGTITKEEARVEKGEAVGGGAGTAIGGTAGALKGAAAGAAIGSVVPVLGTAVGGIIGAALGGWLGSKAGKAIGEVAGGGIAKMTSDADKKVDEASKKAEAKKDDNLAKDTKAGSDVVKVSIVKVEDSNLMKALGAMTPMTKLGTPESTGNVATKSVTKSETKSFTFSEMELAKKDEKLYKEYLERKKELFDKELESRKKNLPKDASAQRVQGAENVARMIADMKAKEEFAERAEKVGAAKIDRPVQEVKAVPQTAVAKAPDQPTVVAKAPEAPKDTSNDAIQRKVKELEETREIFEKKGPVSKSAQSELAYKNILQQMDRAIANEKAKANAPKASIGGIFDGPKSGYPVELHGKEMITPLGTGMKTAGLSDNSAERDEELEEEIEALAELKKTMRDTDASFDKLSTSILKLNKLEEEKLEASEDQVDGLKGANDKLKDVFRSVGFDLSKFASNIKVVTQETGSGTGIKPPEGLGGIFGSSGGGGKPAEKPADSGLGMKPPSAPPLAGMGGGTGVKPAKDQDVKQNLGDVKAALMKRGMGDEKYLNAVLGNVMKESGGKVVNENLNYSKTSNERIRSIFGSRAAGKTDEELNKIKSSEEGMGEFMYGKDTKIGRSMGNLDPGDGWKYRGRGYIQLTGKSNYAQASQAVFGDDRLVKDPDLVNDPKVAAEVVAWYMEKGKARMAKAMGIDEKNMSQQDANVLATSQIAGGDVRKKGSYLAGEVMNKVTAYAGSKDIQGIQPSSGGTMVASADTKKSDIPKAQKGGVFEGPETGYIVELHGNETVIPTDKIESLAKKELASFSKMAGNVTTGGDTNEIPAIDTTAIAKKSVKLFSEEMGPTFAGMNEYTGYNAGPMSTDLKAVQGMASKIGAYDEKTQTITDTEAWKKILHSGMATNYDMGPAKVGTEQFGPDAGNILGDRLKEIMDMDKTSLTDAIKQLQEEFKTVVQQLGKDLAQNAAAPIVEGADDSVMAEVAKSMTELVNKMSESNDIQGKILQYSQV